jgi:hypothetical protein
MKRKAKIILISAISFVFISIIILFSYILYYNWKFDVEERKYEIILNKIMEASNNEEINFNNVVPFEWDEMYYIGIPYISEERFNSMVNDNRIKYKDIANDASGRLIFLNNNEVVFDWFIWTDEFTINDEYLHIKSEDAMFIVIKHNDEYIALNYLYP